MSEQLKKLFTARGEKRVLLHHSEHKDGGVGHIMPRDAEVGMYTEAGYVPTDFHNHPFYQYIFGALGAPRSTEKLVIDQRERES